MIQKIFAQATLVSLVVLTATSLQSSAFADSRHSQPYPARNGGVAGEPDVDGCGLGWQVTRERTLLGSITRGTTNATVPPSFGMSSGTLGCAQLPLSQNEQNAVKYAAVNMDSLALDMAAGQGEYLQAFAQTLGCGAVSDSFSQMTQANYSSITKNGQANALEVFENVKRAIRGNAFLSAGCGV
jgi:hypothetical protein